MICPNCKTEALGAKWCPECGIRLEIDDIASVTFNKTEKGDTQKLRPISLKEEESPHSALPKYVSEQTSEKTMESHEISLESQKKTTPSYENPLEIYEKTVRNREKPTPSYEEPVRKYKKQEPGFSDKGINYWIIALGTITVLVVLFVFFRFIGVIPTSEAPELPVQNEEVVLEKEDTETILTTGLDQLKLGNYDEAETIFKAVLETEPQNIEAGTLYQVVYNYNRALKKIQATKYEEAREFFYKIPEEYKNYSIRTDVEKLNEEISGVENAYTNFEIAEKHMKDENFEDALSVIDLIDTKYLSDTDASTVEEYRAEIEEFFKKKEEGETSAESLSKSDAEKILFNFCENLVMAINSKDFSIVENNVSGQFYNSTKTLVQNYIDNASTQSFDMLEILEIHEISDAKWKVVASEGETTFYSDGTQQSSTNSKTYTIENIDEKYYITAVE